MRSRRSKTAKLGDLDQSSSMTLASVPGMYDMRSQTSKNLDVIEEYGTDKPPQVQTKKKDSGSLKKVDAASRSPLSSTSPKTVHFEQILTP